MLGQKKPLRCFFGTNLSGACLESDERSQGSLGLSAHVSCMSPLHKSLFLRHPNNQTSLPLKDFLEELRYKRSLHLNPLNMVGMISL